MKQRFTILFAFISICAHSQFYGDLEIDRDSISDWIVDDNQDYNGTYLFGYSEGEAELRVFGIDSLRIAQLRTYVWQENNWLDTFKLFTNVSIKESSFYSDQVKGRFVKFNTDGKNQKGLWILNPWSYEFYEGGEIGSKWRDGIKGEFPQASTEVLSEEYLEKMNSEELSIMRNEIFARYSYKFRGGGEMDKYFSSQDWYYSNYESVDQFLTSIEQENISRIKKVEKKKNGG